MPKIIFNTVLARALSTALNFLIALLIARHAGPAIKGDVTLIITTTWFLIFLSNILGGQVLIYLIPRSKPGLLVVPAYLWSMLIAIAGFLFLKETDIIHACHIPAIVLLSFFSAIISIHQTMLLGRKQIAKSNIILIIPLVIQTAGVLWCFYGLHINDAYAYIYASLAAYAITLAISFLMVKRHISFSISKDLFSVKELTTSFKFGLLFQLVEVLQLLNLRYYFYQLSLQQGSKYLGIFSIGISILEAVWIIPRSIATVHYVNTAHSGDLKTEAERTVRLFKTSFILCAIALFAIWLVPSQIYTFVFGPGFSDVKHSMRFLFPGILVYSFPLVIGSFYLGTGKYKSLIISNMAGFLSLVLFSWLLIPRYVMSGAGLAATLSFTIAALVLLVLFLKDTEIKSAELVITQKDYQQMLQGMKLRFSNRYK